MLIHYYLALFFTWLLDLPRGGFDAVIFDEAMDGAEEVVQWDTLNEGR